MTKAAPFIVCAPPPLLQPNNIQTLPASTCPTCMSDPLPPPRPAHTLLAHPHPPYTPLSHPSETPPTPHPPQTPPPHSPPTFRVEVVGHLQLLLQHLQAGDRLSLARQQVLQLLARLAASISLALGSCVVRVFVCVLGGRGAQVQQGRETGSNKKQVSREAVILSWDPAGCCTTEDSTGSANLCVGNSLPPKPWTLSQPHNPNQSNQTL